MPALLSMVPNSFKGLSQHASHLTSAFPKLNSTVIFMERQGAGCAQGDLKNATRVKMSLETVISNHKE
jgi:hypothetical protein